MALNLKTLGVRSLTAAVFVVILLGGILLGYLAFSILFFVISMAGLYEFYRISEHMLARPFNVAGFISAIIIYFIFVLRGKIMFSAAYAGAGLVLMVLPFLLLSVALFSRNPDPLKNTLYTLGGLFYAVLPFALLHEIVIVRNEAGTLEYEPHTLLGVILLIWINDTFAYLGGSLFGKRRLMVSVSPGKTWEGTFAGIVCSFAVSFLFSRYFNDHHPVLWPVLGIVVPVLSTIGDLVQSQIKRQADIKDTGTLMPGHGGILDRFDSLIFVIPFVVVLLKLL